MSIEANVMTRQNDVPSDPLARREWVLARLKRRGTSLRKIALELGVSPQAAAQALMLPSVRLEEALAGALEIEVHRLFPERYRADGTRIARTRPPDRRVA
ncbi:helix-turn-helix domain-containing protein [Azospirillum picis]|uniref:Lambda repressor-like predicted transcriptional regulator n=1 Tax=Azospirillum picis TaxID=488438 RepID=A0ABU0MNX4_9PROT|nr:helix-turn-helix domain-containing protein [Azospirillum picis]MBP2301270.1 lambda repressor-like predicted transcriptional regulator [Azospirillum picis]MDQ0535101.1 lambda repressor-like predicted transcriptional regulator [Azospirillum picis]